jgi:hypothetical protein
VEAPAVFAWTFTVSASLLLPPPAWLTMGRITPRTTKTSRRIAATTQVIRFIIRRRLNCCCFLRILSRKTLLSIFLHPRLYTYIFL